MLEVIRLGNFFMKWERYRQSSNVEDRRGQGLGGRGIGIGTVIVALIGGLLFGVTRSRC